MGLSGHTENNLAAPVMVWRAGWYFNSLSAGPVNIFIFYVFVIFALLQFLPFMLLRVILYSHYLFSFVIIALKECILN